MSICYLQDGLFTGCEHRGFESRLSDHKMLCFCSNKPQKYNLLKSQSIFLSTIIPEFDCIKELKGCVTPGHFFPQDLNIGEGYS